MKFSIQDWLLVISTTLVSIAAIRSFIWDSQRRKKEKQREKEQQNAIKTP